MLIETPCHVIVMNSAPGLNGHARYQLNESRVFTESSGSGSRLLFSPDSYHLQQQILDLRFVWPLHLRRLSLTQVFYRLATQRKSTQADRK